MDILISTRNPEQTVSLASEELQQYLSEMLKNEEGVFSVSLGIQPDLDDTMDAFSVCVDETGGSISGANPRSVLLGAYDYLHHLGCRFLSPVKETEVIPVISKGKLPANYEKHASFRHRGICIEGANSVENVLDFIAWLPKVGYNSFFLQFKVPYAFLSRWYHHDKNPYAQAAPFTMEDARRCMQLFDEALSKRGLMLHKVGHGWTGELLGGDTVGSWDAVQKPIQADKQPLAAQVGGKREYWMGSPANTNLCLSNPQTVDAFARMVLDYARQNPTVSYLHVWLADEYNNVCECEQCRKGTISDHYVALLNEIDRVLSEAGMDTRIVFLLYQELLWPPVKARLNNPDRFLLMFAPISRTFEASYDLENIDTRIPDYVPNHIELPTKLSENLAFLKAWQKQYSGEGFVYDYPLGRAHYGDFGYLHISRIIGQDIKKLRQIDLQGYISCQELRASMPNMLPNYVMGRTLFDEHADVEKIIEEYFRAAYPGGAEIAMEFLQQLSDLSSCDYVNGKGPRENPDMAVRMRRISELCGHMEPVLAEHTGSVWWNVLSYHCGYILHLAAALEALARGDEAESARLYRQMRRYVCDGEQQFQNYLDVYRILEVTQKYTGFSQLI